GFYLRKSLKLGPLRLNLSKSGVGMSVGVPGLRVGMSPRGRSYLHAGRGGLYYRTSLGGSGSRSRTRAGARAEPLVIHADTGAAYEPVAEPGVELLSVEPPRSPLLWPEIVIALAGGALGLLLGGVAGWAVAAAAVAGGLALLVAGVRRMRAVRRLSDALAAWVRAGVGSDAERAVERALADAPLPPEARRAELSRHLLLACRAAVEDGVVGDGELALLARLEAWLGGASDFTRAVRADAFRAVWLEAVADHDLSEGEERTLEHVRQRLGIPPEEVEGELELVERLRNLRAIRSGRLPVVRPSIPLRKSEVCHFESEGRLLNEKQLDSFQRDGRKIKVRGLVVDKEGTLLVTDRRTLLVHEGTSSIPHDRVLDVDLDLDANVIRITKDGSARPKILSTPRALEAAALIARLSGAAVSDG
ncbi:MAG TPA: DUF4236 domain-containing protein, partial [Longimicrobiales bacterium]|nr:DUF4236 domain-containing protein [Longimicrobiales bacterium]